MRHCANALIACLWLAAAPATAAESLAGCAGFVDAVPTTIDGQGVWCLRQDLVYSGTSSAIRIGANNVTIDCNGFGVQGVAAANDSTGAGVSAIGRENVTVRNCRFAGFRDGINIRGEGGGHLVEDNLLEDNYRNGIYVYQSGNAVIRRNRIFDTGAGSNNDTRHGINLHAEDGASLDVRDNTIRGVRGTSAYYNRVHGIVLRADANETGTATVAGNRIARLLPTGMGMTAVGISVGNGPDQVFFMDNEVGLAAPAEGSTGISCNGHGVLMRNVARGFETAFSNDCFDGGGNAAR